MQLLIKLSKIKSIFLLIGLSLSFLACNSGNYSNYRIGLQFKEKQSIEFRNSSNRSTAYIENKHIVSKGKNTFISFLDFIDNKYRIHVVHLNDDEVIEEIYLDDVVDNHGGGSIAINQSNKLCIVYGGHVSKLKYKCSLNELNITKWENEKIIDENNIDNIWQTYPSMDFVNNTMYVLYREENINADIRDPKLTYISIEDDVIKNKEYLYLTDNYYSNFSSTFSINNNSTDFLLMKYGILKDKKTRFNKGVSIIRKGQNNSFNEIEITTNSDFNLEKNYYNSNIVSYNNKLYFIIIDLANSKEFMNLYIMNENNKLQIINLLDYEIIKNLIKNGYQPNVRAGIDLNENGDFFIILPFVSQDDNQWNSKSNRVYYFKLDSDLSQLKLIFNSSKPSWLVNIEKKVVPKNDIPKIIYNLLDSNRTMYKSFFYDN